LTPLRHHFPIVSLFGLDSSLVCSVSIIDPLLFSPPPSPPSSCLPLLLSLRQHLPLPSSPSLTFLLTELSSASTFFKFFPVPFLFPVYLKVTLSFLPPPTSSLPSFRRLVTCQNPVSQESVMSSFFFFTRPFPFPLGESGLPPCCPFPPAEKVASGLALPFSTVSPSQLVFPPHAPHFPDLFLPPLHLLPLLDSKPYGFSPPQPYSPPVSFLPGKGFSASFLVTPQFLM